jgi:transposase
VSTTAPISPSGQLATVPLQEHEQLKWAFEELQQENKELKRLIFGSKRERFIPTPAGKNQLSLALSETQTDPPVLVKQTVKYERVIRKAARKAIRQPYPAHLPRVDIIIEPDIDVSDMHKIGEEITEELDLKPATLFIRRYIRPRYVSREETFHVGVLPVRPIEKGMPGPGLLAQLICDKFVLHLPFYRIAQRLEQLGMRIPASTLNSWFEAACILLECVGEALQRKVLSCSYLQVDETPIAVLDKQKKGKTHRGYHWVYYSPEVKLVNFDYQKGRGREGPTNLLKGFQGYLQTDGYAVYEEFGERKGITLVACLAHARRNFEHALSNDAARAEKVLIWIQQIYAVEREAREKQLDTINRLLLRQEKSRPVMEEMGKWLLEEYPKLLSKSKIGQACHYLMSRYTELSQFLQEGRLEVDNNLIENSIRPVALGRKNYLFAGSHNGAKRAALVYSLVISCKLQGINPYEYLQDLLERLPNQPINRLEELLPLQWKPDTP